jgi:hypothetical protein
MPAKETAAALRCRSDSRRTKTTCGSSKPTLPPDQQRDRVLAVLRAAYRAACETQDDIAEDIVMLIGIARAIECGACDPTFAFARAVELDLVALEP